MDDLTLLSNLQTCRPEMAVQVLNVEVGIVQLLLQFGDFCRLSVKLALHHVDKLLELCSTLPALGKLGFYLSYLSTLPRKEFTEGFHVRFQFGTVVDELAIFLNEEHTLFCQHAVHRQRQVV